VEITKDRLIFHFQQRDGNGHAVPARKEWVYELYASTVPASPQGIDTTYGGMWTGDTFMDDPNPKTRRGIYAVDGDTLKLCQPVDARANRPTEFESKVGSGVRLLILERVKKSDKNFGGNGASQKK
jgi:uncharacterized protein (TIGR03067 family)